MQDAMLSLGRAQTLFYYVAPDAPLRRGRDNWWPGQAPAAMFPCKPGGLDDYCFVYAGDDVPGAWESLLRIIGREDLIGDERYSTHARRYERRAEVNALVEGWTLQRTKYEVMNTLAPQGVVAGAILNAKDVFSDPHLRERGMIASVDQPDRGKWELIGSPIKLTESPTEITAAPRLGQHTAEVLEEFLSYSHEKIQALKTDGVV